MSEFLKKLQDAVENEEFNSEAAQRINKINELADNKTLSGSQEDIDKRLEAAGVKNVSVEEAAAISSQYEEKMAKIKERDGVNAQLATLIEIDDMVKLSIIDMFEFIESLEEKFAEKFKDVDLTDTLEEGKEFPVEGREYYDLKGQIALIRNRYDSLLMKE